MSENDGVVADPAPDEASLLEALQRTFGLATAIEPAKGAPSASQVEELRVALETVAALTDTGLAAATQNSISTRDVLAVVYARCAAVAIAASDDRHATRWLSKAEKFAASDELRDELVAASNHRERYRKLVHARNQFANRGERAARKQCNELVEAGPDDALSRAAAAELKAPRELRPGDMPSLWRWNGFGVAFYGSRDAWPDGSYATTHCISALWVPLIPLAAYRVVAEGESYIVMARERLSSFARSARIAVLLAVVAAFTGFVLFNHYTDPTRLARIRFDDTIAAAETSDPETALRSLDAALARDDLPQIGTERAERAGATIVKLTAGFVPQPFRLDNLDQAGRLVRRYQALPSIAQGGIARETVLGVLDGWIVQLGDKPGTAEARLALLRHEAAIAGTVAASLESRITATRLAVAQVKEADWPLDALAILVDPPTREAIALADKIVEQVADSPSLLVDAGSDLDAWLATTTANELRARITTQRALATDAQPEVLDDKVTATQLVEMAKRRPWDQLVVLRQAREEAAADKLAAAAARLAGLGKPGRMIREARLLLGQLSSALGKLEEADALLSSLLGGRLERFVAASAKLADVAKLVETRVLQQLDSGNIPADLRRTYEASSSETDRRDLIEKYVKETMGSDAALIAARDAYVALSDIVPVSLAAGTVKLRRAQAMPDGPARNAMLLEAERTFLAIRAEAEGQPEFRIGLGEIYARLGKVKESEAEFAALLEKNDPALSLLVARTYRAIGSVERAKATARNVFDNPTATEVLKSAAAIQLGLLTTGFDEDESESWYRKADQSIPFVRTSLLEIEGHRLQRQGKREECAAKFAQAAKEHLAQATPGSTDGYNNAGVAHGFRFGCTGDMQALADASAAFEKAYRANRESAIVVGNFSEMLASNGRLRVIGKRIDLRVFQPSANEVESLIDALLESQERDSILQDLAADPDIRRGEQVFAEFEVLAPNSTRPYRVRFERAAERRDEVAAAAVVDRARKAKALDVSESAGTRKQWTSGAMDAKIVEAFASRLARLEAAAAGRLDPKTRAAVQYVIASTATKVGLLKSDAAMIRRGREAAVQAMKLWPALATNGMIVASLIDEAALAADAKAWMALRRERAAGAALTKLASPAATAIKGSTQWGEILGHARTDTSRPGIDDLRIARLLGDASLETRAKTVLDDKLVRLNLELVLVLDPEDPMSKENLAYLDRR